MKNFHNVPRGTILEYIDLLNKWNKKINLVSFKSQEELIDRHILDSLQLIEYISPNEIVYDIGSGAGFPGLILSFAGIKNVNLVEKINKKANFLIAASALSSQKISIYNASVQDLQVEKCDCITARGLASLTDILESTQNLNKQNTRYLLLKGKNLELEIKNALAKWSFEYILYPSKTSLNSNIIELKHVKPHGK